MKNKYQLSQPLANVLEDYLFTKEIKNVRPKTLENYETKLNQFFGYLSTIGIDQIDNVTGLSIKQYLIDLKRRGLKDASIEAHWRVLSTFFQWLEIEKKRQHTDFSNPMAGVPKPRFDFQQPAFFTDKDICKLWDACETPLEAALIHFLLDCALRINEAAAVTIKNIDFARDIVLVEETKGRVPRTVAMTTPTRGLIQRMLRNRKVHPDYANNEYLFMNRKGKPFTPSGLRQVFEKVKERAGVETNASTHGLRRAAISTLLTNGVEIATVKSQSGHRNVQTLIKHYVKVDDELKVRLVKEKGITRLLRR
jgi:site-specific recombinase XerD